MNILFCIETLGRGGAENVLLAMASQLVRYKHKVYVAVMNEPHDLKADFEKNNVTVLVLPKRKKWNLVARSRDLSVLAKQHSADVIHAHLYFPSILTALMRIIWLRDIVAVVTFHNLAYAEGVNKPGFGLNLRKWLGRYFYPKGIDHFLGVSHAVVEHYQQHLNLSAVHVLHNAIDLSKIPVLGALPGSIDSSLCLVVPGRLVPEKGHTYFIDALEKLVGQGGKYQAVFAGGGPLQVKLTNQVDALNLTVIVEITGTLRHKDMLKTIARADIVVIPSVHEGFGLVAIEAMALGKPVIATTAGGLPEIITDGIDGVLVGSMDVDALVESIHRLASDASLRTVLGKRGRKRVEDSFSVVTSALKLQVIYQTLLDQQQ